MAKKPHKEGTITHVMADGTVFHSNEELRTYNIDPEKIPPVALQILRTMLLGPSPIPAAAKGKASNT